MIKHPLWAPWRLEYVKGPKPKGTQCVFCLIQKEPQDSFENLILLRAKHNFLVMNRFPYNNGHLMVLPYQHGGELTELSDFVLQESAVMIKQAVTLLKTTYNPQAFNTGLNLGVDAGGGIVDHIHWHVIPRWRGDTNFMPLTTETKALPEHLRESYERLKKGLN